MLKFKGRVEKLYFLGVIDMSLIFLCPEINPQNSCRYPAASAE